MQVLAPRAVGLNIARPLVGEGGFVRRPQIGRAPEKPGDVLRERVEHFARGLPPRDAPRVTWKNGQIAVPPDGEFTSLHQVNLAGELWVLGSIGLEAFGPLAPGLSAARAHPSRKVLPDGFGDQKL